MTSEHSVSYIPTPRNSFLLSTYFFFPIYSSFNLKSNFLPPLFPSTFLPTPVFGKAVIVAYNCLFLWFQDLNFCLLGYLENIFPLKIYSRTLRALELISRWRYLLPSLRLIPETLIEKGNNVCTHTVFKMQFKILRNCYYFKNLFYVYGCHWHAWCPWRPEEIWNWSYRHGCWALNPSPLGKAASAFFFFSCIYFMLNLCPCSIKRYQHLEM